jgi:hypothetical protein
MLNLLKLAAVAGVATEVKRRTSYALQIAIRSALAGALLVAGAAFLTGAGWLKLSEFYGAVTANMVVGGLLVGMGLLTYVLGVIVPEHYKRRYAAPSNNTMGASASTGATSGIDLSTLATLAAVGVAAGRMFKR